MTISHSQHSFPNDPFVNSNLENVTYYWSAYLAANDQTSFLKCQIRDELLIPSITKLAASIARQFTVIRRDFVPGTTTPIPNSLIACESRILTILLSDINSIINPISLEMLKQRCEDLLNSTDEIFPTIRFTQTLGPFALNEYVKQFREFLSALRGMYQYNQPRQQLINTLGVPIISILASNYSATHSNPDYAKTQIERGLNNLIAVMFPTIGLINIYCIERICKSPYMAEELGFVWGELARHALLNKVDASVIEDTAIPLSRYLKTFYFKRVDADFYYKLFSVIINRITRPEAEEKTNEPINSVPLNKNSRVIMHVSAKKLLDAVLALVTSTCNLFFPPCRDSINNLLKGLNEYNRAHEIVVNSILSTDDGLKLFKLIHHTMQAFQYENIAQHASLAITANQLQAIIIALEQLGETLFEKNRYQALKILVRDKCNSDYAIQTILREENNVAIDLVNAIAHLYPLNISNEENIDVLFYASAKYSASELKHIASLLKVMENWGVANTLDNKKFICENNKKLSLDNFLEIRTTSETAKDVIAFIPEAVSLFFSHPNAVALSKKNIFTTEEKLSSNNNPQPAQQQVARM